MRADRLRTPAPRHAGGAERFGIRATTTAYPMADAQRALAALADGRFSGATVLHN
jgi:propanol-preferring alcohol dehydrogenase